MARIKRKGNQKKKPGKRRGRGQKPVADPATKESDTSGHRSPLASKVSKANLPAKSRVLPPSFDPLEKNVFERVPMPENYVFVPKGNVYITRHCRTNTKESNRIVYVVYVSLFRQSQTQSQDKALTNTQDKSGKRTRGIRVPEEVHVKVCDMETLTAKTRADETEARDIKIISRSRDLLREEYPSMPAESLEIILNHAFLKGSGRVGRTSIKSDDRKAELAVEAHIRHTHTPYDELLDGGMKREKARKIVWPTIQRIKKLWEDGKEEDTENLVMELSSGPV
ncbi:uncharacterized protein N7483_006415 [Penicillium malachiteum]|uniref:uncharacterized protein n=1 Tax=Penicillium malachiteum TaxID=1324776 RepID=UPI00254878A0|nr:uncharacterized protein N7483_006415 [Penicillium malachiteum]KAJ5725058.1 hypothetical protein N7483_006415 [Penicillium malachiteum]